MPPRLTFSLTLNVILLGLVLWFALPGSQSEADSRISRLMTNRMLRVNHASAAPPAREPLPEVETVNEPFHWAQLESIDYRIYLANLRGIGCPESTARDILIADVNDLFSGRVKALVDEVSGQFWNFITHEDEFKKLVDEKGKQLSALNEERRDFRRTLWQCKSARRRRRARLCGSPAGALGAAR